MKRIKQVTQTIKTPTALAKMMAGKAKLMADIIEKSLDKDDFNEHRSNIKSQMLSYKHLLKHDIDNKAFADIYAQTIVYGVFASTYQDQTLGNFSRHEAAQLTPKSNSFLRKLFHDIAGFDLDDRLVWIIDELVNIFLASDVADIMRNFGKATKQEDPVVHFYEKFLGEYNPALRKARGVWYTPEPVVNFIVRAVDDVLKTEFNLPEGIADTSKTKIKVKTDIVDKRSETGYKHIEKEVHKVQILDPATGTGTFLAEVVKHIHKKFKGQPGLWSEYVAKDLIPRLNGFELLMASYAMAHLKLDMLLTETGYKPTGDQRFRISLTNSLEEAHPDSGTLFSNWSSDEADQANAIKHDAQAMVVMGNPPYASSSTNKGEWIMNLLKDYKKDLKAKNCKALYDDYVKFIRFGQHLIDKNGEGVLAYISNNSFLDGLTHSQMRKHLMQSFDKIYILDLHGNSRKKEVCPDGSPDQNVFYIMAGVSINIFIKTGRKNKKQLGKIFHYDLLGKRNSKYSELSNNTLSSIKWKALENKEPYYFFVPKDFAFEEDYNQGFKVNELFKNGVGGIYTGEEEFLTARTITELNEVLLNNYNKSVSPLDIKEYQYRPFENRYMYFVKSSSKLANNTIQVPDSYSSSYNTSKHLLKKNIALILPRRISGANFYHCFLSTTIADRYLISNISNEHNKVFPLYLYSDKTEQQSITENTKRTPNLNLKIVEAIAKKINHVFLPDENIVCDLANGVDGSFSPLDILDYIYAVLHSPTYRDTYKDFLKIDFPRVSYPKDADTFWKMVKLGGEIRQIHLLESPTVEDSITQYLGEGDNVVTRKLTKTNIGYEATTDTHGKVWINDNNYFDNVPLVAWTFYIGGYQPAQKWLKDRRDRELDCEDIFHYNKIIVALTETDRIMKEIDKINFMETENKSSKVNAEVVSSCGS